MKPIRTRIGRSHAVSVATAICIAALALAAERSRAADSVAPAGRACATLVDEANHSEQLLTPADRTGAGTRVIVHADANEACDLVIAPFLRKDGSLPAGWRPLLAHLEANAEVRLPPTDEAWMWSGEIEPFEVFIAFLPKAAAPAAPIRALVAKLRDPETSAAAMRLLAHSLREKLQKWAADDSAGSEKPSSLPTEIAGTTVPAPSLPGHFSRPPTPGFKWRAVARTLALSELRPSVTIYPGNTKPERP